MQNRRRRDCEQLPHLTAIREASQESGEAGLAYDWSAVSRSGVCLRAQGERGLQGLPMSWHICWRNRPMGYTDPIVTLRRFLSTLKNGRRP
jgi:hypothetical protein